VVGFSQVGAESEWRVANTESMKAALSEENGYEMIFDDARNEQENQIRAIRTFIQQDVDYIVVLQEWKRVGDSILQEAKEAGIPVIVTDR
jgi:galactofuranose transport system substrate-binding protein